MSGESEDSGRRPSKRSTVTEERDRTDRISALPESVIVHILSFLPTLDSFRTRVLSRRWQYLWTGVPTLFFDFTDNRRGHNQPDYDDPEEDFDENRDLIDFVEFVDKALVLCDGSVKNFCVKSDYENKKQFASSANSWARFASKNGVEKFELDFHDSYEYFRYDEMYYLLPQFLFTNSMFRELRFSLCRIELKSTVAWNSLKKLSIGYVKLNDDVIQRILAGTPILETLELYNFKGIESLHIGQLSLRRLVLRQEFGVHRLELTAPNVVSLVISGNFLKCQLVDVKSLVEATLSRLNLNPQNDDLVNKAQGLFNSLAHVKTLTLGTLAIKGLSMLHTKRSSDLLIKCECLTIHSGLWMSHPLGLAILLRYFPLLQTLIFIQSPCYKTWGIDSPLRRVEEEFLKSPITFSDFRFLKTIKFFYFWTHGDPDVQLVQILLKNVKTLRKMIIHMGTRKSIYLNADMLFELAQKLMRFQRASPDAELFVYK